MVIYGAVLVLIVTFMPRGIAGIGRVGARDVAKSQPRRR